MTGIMRKPRWTVMMWCSTLLVGALQLGLTSCTRTDAPREEPAHEGDRAVERAGDRTQRDEATPEAKSEFVVKTRERLDKIDRELDRIEDDASAKGREAREDLREEKRQLATKLDELEKDSEQAWTNSKTRLADELGKLENKINDARADLEES